MPMASELVLNDAEPLVSATVATATLSTKNVTVPWGTFEFAATPTTLALKVAAEPNIDGFLLEAMATVTAVG